MGDNSDMLAVMSGDTGRLAILYEKYKRPLYAYFYKVTRGNRPASEDLVQIVFHRVLKYKERYSEPGSFVNWLFGIARNCGIDYNRTRRFSYSIDPYSNQLLGDDDTEENLFKKERLGNLYRALDRLDPSDKEILILGKIDELKYKDIATILDCSESAVRVRIFRALKRLKEVYVKIELAEK